MNSENNFKDNEELIKKIKRLEQLYISKEALASLGELLPGFTHEINTPLGVAITAISYLDKMYKKTSDLLNEGMLKKSELVDFFEITGESIEIITSNLGRAVAMVLDFKEVSIHHNNDEKMDFDLDRYLNTIIKTLKPIYKHSAQEVVLESVPLIVHSYPSAFSHVFTNLITNSVIHGFTDDFKGSIKIRLKVEDHLIITYEDDGGGINEDYKDRIFEPYFTTAQEKGGSGLGMSIVKSVIEEQLNGSIHYDSNHDKGVRFIIDLPLELIKKEIK
jgi:signal transduction histidine kinase